MPLEPPTPEIVPALRPRDVYPGTKFRDLKKWIKREWNPEKYDFKILGFRQPVYGEYYLSSSTYRASPFYSQCSSGTENGPRIIFSVKSLRH